MSTASVAEIAASDPRTVTVGSVPLTPDEVVSVARHGARVSLAAEALERVEQTRTLVELLADDPQPHYGISTGFGALATTFIVPERRRQLQASLIRSHAAGTGPEVEGEVVRALMLLRLQTLASGRTGVRREVVETYAGMLDAGITPIVREYGSLGCSGDLAPLSHVALAAMGEGDVRVGGGDPMPAAEALAAASLTRLVLREKEGLALINGTDGMLGMLLLAIDDLSMLLDTADVAAAMSVESQLGTDAVFAADLMALRPQLGQTASAENLRRMLAGSPLMASHRDPSVCTRVQDAYSLRCSPQVHGAARDTLEHARLIATRELAATVDNPVITLDGRVESNGNFHGAPIAAVLDFLAISVADVASISERRTDRALDAARSNGLPPFLADEVGVDSGLMIAQYSAAGIVSELKRLAVPASVDSIPSSAMQEDHVSMGWAAARKLRRAVDGLTRVLAIELITAARALDLRAPLAPAARTADARAVVRTAAGGPGPDRFLSPEIESVVELVAAGAVAAVLGARARPAGAGRADREEKDGTGGSRRGIRPPDLHISSGSAQQPADTGGSRDGTGTDETSEGAER
ncbi:Histidine ammonia-lyase [Microbacterium lemovicicum]|uniref:Histidine ammonia-lyase n=1 Tax=Microbacterium lemovicicum TaxID=1072463 RepID=A0A3Q9IYW1_9MICO|nr:histidine ammonia-lyase [Microbacterium lemovicicum]AZS37422.1 Histidine ammonia-lyase [Microbacterium lemovicicum]